MAQPAIRDTDVHVCPAHGGEKIGAVVQLDITVNNEAGLHVGLGFTCGGQPTKITTGASTVRFHGEFAARAFDDSGHGGKLLIGSRNVVIGGPRGMGCVGAGTKACADMAGGRMSGKTNQSYGNCMPESLRQIVQRATGNRVTEDEMMTQALANGATSHPGFGNHGGLSGYAGARLLSSLGVPAEAVPASGVPTLDDIRQAIAGGKGVVATFHTAGIWPPEYGDAVHATFITGVELDDQGNVVAVFMNDTGLGDCGRRVPANKLLAGMNACKGAHPLVVTKGAIG